MADPTAKVVSQLTDFMDGEKQKWQISTVDIAAGGAQATYQNCEMMGLILSGSAAGMMSHFDDTQPMVFAGLWTTIQTAYATTDSPPFTVKDVIRPRYFSMPSSGATPNRTTDLGKALYAVDSGHVQIGNSGLVNGNFVGWVQDVVTSSQNTMAGTVAAGWVIVPAYAYTVGAAPTTPGSNAGFNGTTGAASATSAAGGVGTGYIGTAGTGGANSSTGTGGAGGPITELGGVGGTAVTGTGGAGGAGSFTGGTGGAASGAAGTGGAGGAVTSQAGVGGASAGAIGVGGAGGAYTAGSGAGGANGASTTTGTAGAGGASVYSSGAGGATAGIGGTGGAGGSWTANAGAGGAATAASGASAGGAGGAWSAGGGAGGAVSSASTGAAGVGGAVTLSSGAGGAVATAASGAAGGAAGTLSITGGVGGATANSGSNAGGAGATIAIAAGAGGAASAGTGNGGAGGNITITPGVGGTSVGGTAGANGSTTVTALVMKSTSAAQITAARTLTAADSGGTFSVAKTSGYAITLPTPAQGIRFRFMVLDAGANAVTISDGSAHLFGVVNVAGTNTIFTGTTITLVATGGIGDWVEIIGIDATHYHVIGACVTAAKITVA